MVNFPRVRHGVAVQVSLKPDLSSAAAQPPPDLKAVPVPSATMPPPEAWNVPRASAYPAAASIGTTAVGSDVGCGTAVGSDLGCGTAVGSDVGCGTAADTGFGTAADTGCGTAAVTGCGTADDATAAAKR